MSNIDASNPYYNKALSDFHEARRKAALETLFANISGKSNELLDYDLVRRKLNALESNTRKLEMIPLDKIVGSVNRYTDFTRSFLPRQESDVQRWALVRVGVETLPGLPPIETYRVDDVYFVLDGHHRVSVARELGMDSIEGYVARVQTSVPLSPGDFPDDLILKAEYADFLNQTHMDRLRPGSNLLVTAPGQYPRLLEHINVHRYFMGQNREQDISEEEALTDWYDNVYLPVAEMMRERNLLRDFPTRTETDLYLWIMEQRTAIGGALGWEVSPELAATDLTRRYSRSRRMARIGSMLTNLLIPDPLTSGPPPGQWRQEHQSPRRADHMFDDLLVTVPGVTPDGKGWQAVHIAIEVAHREEARLTGLHAIQQESDRNSETVQTLDAKFKRLCAEAGIAGRLLVEVGAAAQLICQRSPWLDLVIFRLNYPPPSRPLARLRSGARLLIRRCSSPILAVPDATIQLGSALLAYGPGPKAEEALFVATYLAGRWNIPLTVLIASHKASPTREAGEARSNGAADGSPAAGSPADGSSADQLPSVLRDAAHGISTHDGAIERVNALQPSATQLERARTYLETHGVQATYIEETGDAARRPADAVLLNAEAQGVDFIIMGGYESAPLREAIFSSTVDKVLRSTRRPVLICR